MQNETINQSELVSQKEKTTLFIKLSALISYLGPFSLILFILNVKNHFIRYHIRQGLVIFLFEIFFTLIWIVPVIGWIIGFIGWIICDLLSIIGIVIVLLGKKQPIPFINWLGRKLKI